MSQSSAAMMQTPNPMKKKVIAALVAVVVGHMGVLFAISHLKTPELRKIEKEPLKVRFVQIKEDAPPPPPPAEPVKPQVQPKPKPKVVEPPPVVKPKIIAEKPKPQEKAKPVVVVDDTLEKQKREQERLDEQRKNQERLEQQQREKERLDEQRKNQERLEQQQREQAARNTPKNLSQGQISWSRSPKPSYTNRDLEGSDRMVVVSVEADTSGQIIDVRIVKSSGISSLDQKIVRAVRSAKFKPYKENGVAYPFKAQQPFELKLNSNG